MFIPSGVLQTREVLGESSLLPDDERRQLLIEWNDTEADYPKEQCFQHLFEFQVERTPQAIAVAWQDTQLTYRELNRRANQLAWCLRAYGVGPDVLVGICAERSPEMMVGLLGILKAGGAYVPLDPTYPQERLAFMLNDSHVPVLLTQSRLLERLPSALRARTLCLDTDWSVISQGLDTNPPRSATADHLAYVIYTSGSTGRPKGVMIRQQGLVNYLTWCVQRYDVAAGEGALVHSSISFDLTITGLFAPLLVGRTVYLLPEQQSMDGLAAAWRRLRNLSLVKITPAHLDLLSHQLAPQEAAGRARVLVIGGENLSAERLAFWRQFAPETVLINEYGPTETVVGCCIYQVPADHPATGSVPIGRPIANTRLYILDQHLQPVPVGVVGELYIGGAGVARGYLNRPDLTRARFLPDPFTEEAGTFLYKTGDLARYRQDGNIEFLGRSDDQVKIRGYRIELGEIDAVLTQHPCVRQSTTVALEDGTGQKRLVSYVVAGEGNAISAEDLRGFLQQRLPEYMLPSAFLALAALPLTPNGKVDRHALPAPASLPAAAREVVPPRDALERQLVSIWEKALGVHPIGVTDDFFALGGHSLSAAALSAALAKTLGQTLPGSVLLQARTVEQLARVLREDQGTPCRSLVAIQAYGSGPALFCVHPVGGDVLCYRALAEHLRPDHPVYGLQAQGLDGRRPPHTCTEDMAAHYIQEMRTLQPEGPYFLVGLSFGGLVALEMAQQLRAQGQDLGLVALLDTAAPGYIAPLPRRLPGHLRAFFHLPLRKKLQYLARVPGAISGRVQRGLWRAGHNLHQLLGQPPPRFLRSVAWCNDLAASTYVPRIYTGPVALFRAEVQAAGVPDDPKLGWGEWLSGGLDVYHIPGAHAEITHEPVVPVVAEHLKGLLRKARVAWPA